MRSPIWIIAFIRCWNYENRISLFLVHCIVQCKVKFVLVLAYHLLDVFGVWTCGEWGMFLQYFWPVMCREINTYPYNWIQTMVCIRTVFLLSTYATGTSPWALQMSGHKCVQLYRWVFVAIKLWMLDFFPLCWVTYATEVHLHPTFSAVATYRRLKFFPKAT